MVRRPAVGSVRRTPAGGAGKGVREEGRGLVRPVCSGTYAEVREEDGSVQILTRQFSNVGPFCFSEKQWLQLKRTSLYTWPRTARVSLYFHHDFNCYLVCVCR